MRCIVPWLPVPVECEMKILSIDPGIRRWLSDWACRHATGKQSRTRLKTMLHQMTDGSKDDWATASAISKIHQKTPQAAGAPIPVHDCAGRELSHQRSELPGNHEPLFPCSGRRLSRIRRDPVLLQANRCELCLTHGCSGFVSAALSKTSLASDMRLSLWSRYA